MKELVEDDLMGYDTATKVLYARFDREGSVSLGNHYRVPKQYIHSGIGEVTRIDKINISGSGAESEAFWVADLVAAIAKPADPCDEEFMEEISS